MKVLFFCTIKFLIINFQSFEAQDLVNAGIKVILERLVINLTVLNSDSLGNFVLSF